MNEGKFIEANKIKKRIGEVKRFLEACKVPNKEALVLRSSCGNVDQTADEHILPLEHKSAEHGILAVLIDALESELAGLEDSFDAL